ncbi:MAG: glycosyltransferase, partial [Bdellovibrionota bacterium]
RFNLRNSIYFVEAEEIREDAVMPAPRVTVVLPVFNGERFIRDAVESILSQTLEDFELIVIDDGSTDRTPEILSLLKDDRLSVHRNDTNLKLISSLNRGLVLARGEFIARMDADDISKPERLAKQVAFLDSHPDIDLVGTDILVFESDPDDGVRLMPPPVTSAQIRWELLRVSCLYHPTVMMRRSIFDSEKAYDPTFTHSEDYELWLRLSRTRKLWNIIEPLLLYRRHENSISRTQAITQRERAEAALAHEIEVRIGIRPSRAVTGPLMQPWSLGSLESVDEFRRIFPLLVEESLTQGELSKIDRRFIEDSALATILRLVAQALRHKRTFVWALFGTILECRFSKETFFRFPFRLGQMVARKLVAKI